MPVSISSSDVTFTTTSADVGRVENVVTTAAPTAKVTFKFTVARNPLTLRVGTTTGAQDVVTDIEFPPGKWVITFTPGAATYYLQFAALKVGKATLTGFARVAAGRFSIDTPWAGADISSIRFQQSLNVVWAAQRSYRTQVIERRGATSWGVRDYAPDDGPFFPLNATDYTLTPSALTGEITITANGPVFTALDAGMLLKLTHSGQYETATANSVDDATDWIKVTGIGDMRAFSYDVSGTFTATVLLERSVGTTANPETVTSITTATAGTLNDGFDNQIIYYRLRTSAYTSGSPAMTLAYSGGVTDGVARILSVSADNSVTADVIEPFAKTDATSLWYMGAWSTRSGWPAAVGMHDGRLALGRAYQYWLSAADDFESHLIGPNDADAISRTLTGKMNAISWLKGVDQLLAGTIGAEHRITAGALAEVLTPSTVFSKPISGRGSADTDAVPIDNAIAFIDRTRDRIYLATPDGDGYTLVDLTRLHRKIGGATGFKELAFQSSPEPRLWALRNDGQVAILAIDLAEQVAAWFRYKMEGATIKSLAIVPAGAEDAVYFVVDRGNATYLIERLAMEDYDTVSEAWRLQGAVEYSGTALGTLTGLSHLEGDTVHVWGNGREYGPLTVSGGSVTLPNDATVTYAITGVKYTGKFKGGRLDGGGAQGTALTQMKQVTGLGMMLYKTPGGMLKWGRSFTDADLTVLDDRVQDGTLVFDGPLQEQTIDEWFEFAGERTRDPRLHFVMDGAGPVTILGIVPKVDVNDR